MSGGSEADFELGYRVNVDSHLALLKQVRRYGEGRDDGKKVVYVYFSGLAVYGGPKCEPRMEVDPE